MGNGNFLIVCLVIINDDWLQAFKLIISLASAQFNEFLENFQKLGNIAGI